MNLEKFKELAEENLVEINKTKGMFGVTKYEIIGIEELYKALIIHFISGSLIVNGFDIKQSKNADNKYLPPNFLQWEGKHILTGQQISAKTKKECIRLAENYC